jgi:hypothetical protein
MSAAAVKVLWGGHPKDASVPHSRNRGIGFKVVRELVQNSGGTLRLRSRLGSGTTVSITWAVAKEAKDGTRPDVGHDLAGNPLEKRRLLMAIARNGRTLGVTC